MENNYVIYNGELYHHGVKGQKWGVRRFQREDGSLTPAGKKRVSEDTNDKSTSPAKKMAKQNEKEKEFREMRTSVGKTRTAGAKIATNILAGPFANRTYNSVIAAGGTKNAARVVTGLTSLGGPLAHLVVSAMYASDHGERGK